MKIGWKKIPCIDFIYSIVDRDSIIDWNTHKKAVRRKLGINSDQFSIGYIAAFNEKKDQFSFIKNAGPDLKKDEVIFNQGASPDDIYIIQRGRVKIVEELSSDSLEIISFTTGDCFGETELIGIFPYIASAVATEDTDLIVFPRKALRVLYKDHLPIFTIIILNIARESCRRLAQTDKKMFELIEKRPKNS